MSIATKIQYCSKCKVKDVPFIKYSSYGGVSYYRCRPCNSEHARKYRRTEKGMANIRKALRKSINKYPEKQFARKKVSNAINKGLLVRPLTCSQCNVHGRIEGHHLDYDRPLDVLWLCTSCHAKHHKDFVL